MVANSFGIPGGMLYNEPMPIEPQQDRLYSVTEAAAMLGKSEQAIRNLCQRGRLSPVRQVSGVWLISETAIRAFVPNKRGKHITKR